MLLLAIGAGCARAGGIPNANAAGLESLPDSLSPRQVNAVVEAHKPAIQRCYDDWLKQHPLRSTVVFELSAEVIIGAAGDIERVQLRGIDDQPKLAGCIEQVLATARFPRSQFGAELVAPLMLAGRERPTPESLSARQLYDLIRVLKSSIAVCFEREQGELPSLVASLSINPDGSTRAAQLRGADEQPALKSCVRETMLSWRFPTAGKGAEYAFPL
ncbi:MAG TPA: hypothetical protein VI299_12935 [Polyangiales bacterium]